MLILKFIDPTSASSSTTHTFDTAGGLIGSGEMADWLLPAAHIQPAHAQVLYQNGHYKLIPQPQVEILDPFGLPIDKAGIQLDIGMRLTLGDGDLFVEALLSPMPESERDIDITAPKKAPNTTQVEEHRSPTSPDTISATPTSPLAEVMPAEINFDADFYTVFSEFFNLGSHFLSGLSQSEANARLCHLLQDLLDGLIQLLVARAKMKNQLKLDLTLIDTIDNNPIKYCVNAREAISRLLSQTPNDPAFMDVRQAIQHAFEDIHRHQDALLGASLGGIEKLLDQLSPQIDTTAAQHPVRRRFGLAQWKNYRKAYQKLRSHQDRGAKSTFMQGFVSSYLKQDSLP